MVLVQHCCVPEGEVLREKDPSCIPQICQLLTGFTGSWVAADPHKGNYK